MSETNASRLDAAAVLNGWAITVERGLRTYDKNGEVLKVVMTGDLILRASIDGSPIRAGRDFTQTLVDELEA